MSIWGGGVFKSYHYFVINPSTEFSQHFNSDERSSYGYLTIPYQLQCRMKLKYDNLNYTVLGRIGEEAIVACLIPLPQYLCGETAQKHEIS
jgi:hypothetical protein